MKCRTIVQCIVIMLLSFVLVACGANNNKDGNHFITDPIGNPIGEFDDPLQNPIDELDDGMTDSDEVDDENKSTEEQANTDEHSTCPDEAADKEYVEIEFLRKSQLCKGIVQGLEVQIGDMKIEMRAKLGESIESDYFEGGYYDAYDVNNHRVMYFGEEDGVIEHIWLVPYDNIPLQMVRDLLGEADIDRFMNDEYGDDEERYMLYDYGDYTFRVFTDEEDERMNVLYFFLKSEEVNTP